MAVCVVAGVDDGTGAGVEGSIKRGAVVEPGARWSGSAGGEDMADSAEGTKSSNPLWFPEKLPSLFSCCCST